VLELALKGFELADLYVAGSLPQDILDAKSEELNQRRLRFEAESKALLALQPRRANLDRLYTPQLLELSSGY